MKDYIYYRNKRESMGLTISDVAKMAGMSPLTVRNFEDPDVSARVSEPYKVAIKKVLCDYHDANYPRTKVGTQSYETCNHISLIQRALSLNEPEVTDAEKLDIISDMIVNLGYLHKAYLKTWNTEIAKKSGRIIEEGNRPLRVFTQHKEEK